MKKLLLFFISLVCIFACQKKQKDTPGPQPEEIEITPLTDPAFIQHIEVAGAEKIVFDSTLDAYQITLRAGYTANEVGIQFKLYPGAYLNWSNTSSQTFTDFSFKNKPPLRQEITNLAGQTKTYEFYVKHSGPLKAAIEAGDEFQLQSSGGLELSCNFITGIGTVPDSPGAETKLIASLADGSIGKEIIGNTWLNSIYFENARQFEKSSELSVVLRFGDKTFELAKHRKLLPIGAYVHLFGDFPLFSAAPLNKPIPISGSGFSAKAAYKVTIESDFISNPLTVPAVFSDAHLLKCSLPSGIPDGSYTVSVFENDTLVKSLVRVIAQNEKEKAIGQIWVSQNEYFINSLAYHNAKKIVAGRGQSIYVNPFPAVLGQMYAAFNPNQTLADLLMKSGRSSITLKPVVRADPSYADGSIKVYYGQYSIPDNLAPGSYEARLVYADKTESLPFWNKIEVR